MILTKGDQARDACKSAADALRKIDSSRYSDIISKLEFCIGSYDFDQNPIGLYEFAQKAFILLSEIKKTSPKKVNQKLLSDLKNSF